MKNQAVKHLYHYQHIVDGISLVFKAFEVAILGVGLFSSVPRILRAEWGTIRDKSHYVG